jgi:hypothetical protein
MAIKIGIKEAVVLFRLCKIFAGKEINAQKGMALNDLLGQFKYFSKDQMRDTIAKLKVDGYITGERSPGEFTRKMEYRPTTKALDEYNAEIMRNYLGININA